MIISVNEGGSIMKEFSNDVKVFKKDKAILDHLSPIGEFADTYFCSIYYKNKEVFMYSVYDKVAAWVEQNGGKIKRVSDKRTIGERKGFVVKIIFPTFNKRDMKNIMATVY